MNVIDLQNSDKLGSEFSNFVMGYTNIKPANLVNDYIIQQGGLPNGERLSDDYNTTLGFNGEKQSNFQIFGIGKPSAKQLAKKEKKDVNQQITGCVKPKAVGIGVANVLTGGVANLALAKKYKADMAAYNKCLQDAKNKIQSQATISAESKNTIDELNRKLEEARAEVNNTSSREENTTADDGKILGIPKVGFWVGVGALALIGGVIFYKKVIAKK